RTVEQLDHHRDQRLSRGGKATRDGHLRHHEFCRDPDLCLGSLAHGSLHSLGNWMVALRSAGCSEVLHTTQSQSWTSRTYQHFGPLVGFCATARVAAAAVMPKPLTDQ